MSQFTTQPLNQARGQVDARPLAYCQSRAGQARRTHRLVGGHQPSNVQKRRGKRRNDLDAAKGFEGTAKLIQRAPRMAGPPPVKAKSVVCCADRMSVADLLRVRAG